MGSQSVSHWAGSVPLVLVEVCLATTRSRVFKALIGCAILNEELAATRWTRVRRDTISMMRTGIGVVERYDGRRKEQIGACLTTIIAIRGG